MAAGYPRTEAAVDDDGRCSLASTSQLSRKNGWRYSLKRLIVTAYQGSLVVLFCTVEYKMPVNLGEMTGYIPLSTNSRINCREDASMGLK